MATQMQATFATDFSIEYFDNFKIVTNNYNETSPYVAVLYPCGTQQPGANAVQRLLPEAARVGYFAVPLTAVATGDTTAGWALVCMPTSACAPLLPLCLLRPRLPALHCEVI